MAENGSVTADGYTGKVTFDGSTVTITHNWKGKVGGWKQPHAIHLSALSDVEFVPASALKNGYLDARVPGETQLDGTTSRNIVMFTKKQSEQFENAYLAIRSALSKRPAEQILEVRAAENQIQQDAVARVTARYGLSHSLSNGTLAYPGGMKSTAGAIATFDSGADRSRPTLTRIGAGAIIAGPAGAIVGGLFKKNTASCYITVEFPDGEAVIVEGPSKDETKLRKFAASINLSAHA